MRVGIVGAGFSGLLAAYWLEMQGFSVTVFEKEARLGGHCRTFEHGGLSIEMGTVFGFRSELRGLFTTLDVGFTERYSHREFVNSDFERVEQLSYAEAEAFKSELLRLSEILDAYPEAFDGDGYGRVYEDLKMSMGDFLALHGFELIGKAIYPHLAAFGFGVPWDLPAFYGFSVFDLATIQAFVRGEKLLYVDQGFTELVRKLSLRVTDIRYGQPVTSMVEDEGGVRVFTAFGDSYFDKVLVSAVLPSGVLEEGPLAQKMGVVHTNPYVSIAYKVVPQNSGTTYCLGQLGSAEQLLFYHSFRQRQKTVLIAYAYGDLSEALVKAVSGDLKRCEVQVKHVVAAESWRIFPHVRAECLCEDFYTALRAADPNQRIHLMGTLVSRPAVGSLYHSVKRTIGDVFRGSVNHGL